MRTGRLLFAFLLFLAFVGEAFAQIPGGGGGVTIGAPIGNGGSCSSGYVLYFNSSGQVGCQAVTGTGTVTSAGASFTGGLISVGGSPITAAGTLAFTVAGTSGGIPYFTSTSAWASSSLLTANALMIGGGSGTAPSTTTTGANVLTAISAAINANTGLPNISGSITTNDCLKWGPGIADAGSACGGGSTAFPITVTGGVSGAVPCFTATTTESAGTLLAANAIVIGGGAGACPTSTTTGTGVVTAIGNAVNAAGGLVTSAVTSLGSLTTASALVTVGTIGTGTWAGTNVALNHGGTNAAITAAAGGAVYSTASALAVTAAGTSGQVLESQGTSAPIWATISGSGTVTSISGACGIGTGGSPITTTGTVTGTITPTSQTGSNYAFASGDCGNLVALNNAGAQSPTLNSSLGTGYYVSIVNIGAGTQTLTPNSGTICGSSTQALTTKQGLGVAFDGTNWVCDGGPYLVSGNVALSNLASQAANTVVANVTSGSASPTAASLPSCSSSASILQYLTSTGFQCVTSYPLSGLAAQAANTFVANVTSGSAAPTAASLPSCSANGNALQYLTSTGFQCNTVSNLSLSSGAISLTGTFGIAVCTTTCTVTLPAPVAGAQYCAINGDNVSTVITMAAISSVQFEVTARTSYKTANTAIASGGAVNDKICYIGIDTTHYIVGSFNGTWS